MTEPRVKAGARTYLEGTSAKLFEPKAQAAILMIINSYTSFPQYLATMLVKSLFNLLGTEETQCTGPSRGSVECAYVCKDLCMVAGSMCMLCAKHVAVRYAWIMVLCECECIVCGANM